MSLSKFRPSVAMRTPLCIRLANDPATQQYKEQWYGPAFMTALKTNNICTVLDMQRFCFFPSADADIDKLTVMQRLHLFFKTVANADLMVQVLLESLTSQQNMPPGMPIVVKWLPHTEAQADEAQAWQCILKGIPEAADLPASRYVASANGQFDGVYPIQLHLDSVELQLHLPGFAQQYTLPMITFLEGTYIGHLNSFYLPHGEGRLLTKDNVKRGIWQNGTLLNDTTHNIT